MHKFKIIAVGLGAAAAISAAGIAYSALAEDRADDQTEIAALSSAKTSLAQAIAIAEQQSGGKAIEAGLENENGKLVFEVKVAKAGSVEEVFVDSAAGTVVSAGQGSEHEDEHED